MLKGRERSATVGNGGIQLAALRRTDDGLD